MSPSEPKIAFRFAAFEVDLGAGELYKCGVRISLQEQPFRILVALLERAGHVVTREELQQQVWPEGTFVDFERGLNTAVNRLRDALGDSAVKPRYIETVPRRGYRFIGVVEDLRSGLETVPSAPDGSSPVPPRRRAARAAAIIAGILVPFTAI